MEDASNIVVIQWSHIPAIVEADEAQYRANYIRLLVPVACNMGNKGNQYETTMKTFLCLHSITCSSYL